MNTFIILQAVSSWKRGNPITSLAFGRPERRGRCRTDRLLRVHPKDLYLGKILEGTGGPVECSLGVNWWLSVWVSRVSMFFLYFTPGFWVVELAARATQTQEGLLRFVTNICMMLGTCMGHVRACWCHTLERLGSSVVCTARAFCPKGMNLCNAPSLSLPHDGSKSSARPGKRM